MAGKLVEDKGSIATYHSDTNGWNATYYNSDTHRNLEAYLALLCSRGAAKDTNAETTRNYALNIIAARMALEVEPINKAYVDCTKDGVTDEKKLAEELRAPKYWENVRNMKEVKAVRDMFGEMDDVALCGNIQSGKLADKLVEHIQKAQKSAEQDEPEKKLEAPKKEEEKEKVAAQPKL